MVRTFLGDDAIESGTEMNIFDQAVEQAAEEFQTQAEQIVEEVIESIPEDYTELTEEVEQLNERIDNEGLSEDAKVALLNCFAHVAWIDEHGQDYYDTLEDALYPETGLVSITAVFTQGSAVIYPTTPLNDLKAYLVVTGHYNDGTSKSITDYSLSGTLEVGTSTVTVMKEGKTTTFTVTVSAPYWDYEWDASSETLPTGMTADYYDFTTEAGAIFAKSPNLDFNYIGSCRLQIEMLGFYITTTGDTTYTGSNPQVGILANGSGQNKQGVKFVWNFDGAGEPGIGAVGVNGVNSILNVDTTQYHLIDLTNNNGVYALSVDGVSMPVTQNTNTTPYISRTGIVTSTLQDGAYYGAYIRSIKFKRL